MLFLDLRRIGVIAATLCLLVVLGGLMPSGDAAAHTCGATDKRFIETASINLTAMGAWTQDYRNGAASADMAREAFDSAQRVSHVTPRDPSLRRAQTYLGAMFTEYGEAIALQAEGRPAGERMYRAYGLANFARDVLVEARTELANRGCDVAPLL